MKTFILKRMMSITLTFMFFGSSAIAQQLLIDENFQGWTPTTGSSYASGSQEVASGTLFYENVRVRPDYPNISRIINTICSPVHMQITDASVITLPELTKNISKIQIHAYSGVATKRTFKVLANESELQTCEIKGSAANGETGEIFEIPVNSTTPTTISIGYANGTIYISDIKVYDTSNNTSNIQHVALEEEKIIREKYYSPDGLEVMQEYLIQGKMYIKKSMYENGQVQVIKFIR